MPKLKTVYETENIMVSVNEDDKENGRDSLIILDRTSLRGIEVRIGSFGMSIYTRGKPYELRSNANYDLSILLKRK